MEYKEFEDIELGDIGEDYDGNVYKIIDYGTVDEMLNMSYDSTGALEDGLDEGYIDSDDEAVVVEDLDLNNAYAFVYGSDGFRAYK